jgi:cytosine/adenosine deaminase-related metal-dependent hydrolase
MAASSILLQGGVALLHDADEHVQPTKTDILIEGNKITKISENIEPPAGTEVVNCTDKIISPGFISTHHHVWQTQLRGRSEDETFLEV